MGDTTRIVDGKKQSYFLGFGWVDDKGENECIFLEDMYENGNKIGIMGQSDGDINKIVGTMDKKQGGDTSSIVTLFFFIRYQK